jgi:bacillolysin
MKTNITFLMTLMTCIQLTAQVKKQEVKLRDQNGNPKLIELKVTKISNQKESINTFLKQQFKTSESTEFRAKSNQIVKKQKKGFENQKLQQYYKGVKVEHGRLNAISKNGNLSKVVGSYVSVENLSTTPNLTKEQALNFALKHINAEKYIWEDEASEILLKNEQNNPNASHFPKGELVIIEKRLNTKESEPRLAYKFDIYCLKPLSRANYFIDAVNGEVLLEDKILKHIEGTGNTRFSGIRTIETEQIGSQFRLRDNIRGNGIHTFNMNNGSNYGSATDLTDNDNNWTAAEYNNANKDNALLDAHWGAINTYDYFFNEHGRNSIDNSGFLLRNYVNANLTGFGYSNSDNAFWDGQRMTYGIGTTFDPLVSIDVIAHEIGHGLDQFTSNLVYQNESGAIDESLSDIWGAMVEFYAAPEKQTYLLAEDIGFVIRSMSNPKSYGDPDTYQGQNWWTSSGDNGGVHTNSGVMNHWFYLLAEGSDSTDGVNDNGDIFNINGIGKTKAAQIVYRAQTVYFNDSFLTYADARVYTLQAAEDLFGVNSLEASTTCQSWFAVGIGDGNCAEGYDIAGNNIVCPNSTYTYTVTGLPASASVSWSSSPNIQIVNTTSNSVTVTTSSNGQNGQIFLDVNGAVSEREIWLGRPATPSRLSGFSLVNTGAIVNYSTSIVGGATSYEWRLPYPYNTVSTFNYFGQRWELQLPATGIQITAFTGYAKNSGYVQVWGRNECGNGGAKLLSVSHATPGGTKPGGGGIPISSFGAENSNEDITIHPNPVDNILKINLVNSDSGFVKIYNLQGQLIQEAEITSNKLELNTSNLQNGIFFVDITQGKEKITKKIIVQH